MCFSNIIKFTLILFAVFTLGCGAKTVSSTGKVSYKGKPVTSGSLVFAPVGTAGKPATCDIGADGTFSIDGVTAGKNKVSYSASGEADEHGEVKSEFKGLVTETSDVTVEEGSSLELTLVKGSGTSGGSGAHKQ